jgi:hypothetical protein
LESKWFDAFEAIPLNDQPGRDRCVTILSVVRQLKKDLENDAREGESAFATMRDIEEAEK